MPPLIRWCISYANGDEDVVMAHEIQYLPEGGFRLYNVKPGPSGELVESYEVAVVGPRAYAGIKRI